MLVSVIIPTRNRADRLGKLLESLAAQDSVPFKWEVLIVDNGSEEKTHAVAFSASRELPIEIHYVMEPKVGLHHGRHRGAEEAAGEILGYLDDDMLLSPTWIQGCEWVADGRADAVVGRILPKWEMPPPRWLLSVTANGSNRYLGLLDLGSSHRSVDPVMVFGGNCFFPKKLVFDLGGFHPDGVPPELIRYRGDGETALMNRFRKQGLRSFYDPRAMAYHIISPERMSLDYLRGRAYNEGISASFTQIRKQYSGNGLSAPPFTFRYYLERMREKSFGELLSGAKNRLGAGLMRLKSPTCAKIYRELAEAYRAGWEFHQKEVKNDPELLRYVLKENYLD